MSDRRRSVRLAAAVSSILCAPAVALGAGFAAVLAVPLAVAQETSSSSPDSSSARTASRLPAPASASSTCLRARAATATTGASGQFSATGLRVGGPYRVTAQAEGMQEAAIEDLYTQLAQRTSVTLVAQPIAQLAGVEVTGTSERDVSIGAGSRFGAQDVRELPSISRDIKDVVRIDPKAWVDPTNSDALEVAGVNNRYNTITVDGVRQSDDFGLNNNGYPTQRSPLSVDAIEAVSVLTAPFSVEYSFFRGSTINMVTKSGHQRVHGLRLLLQGRRQPAGRPDQGHRGRPRVRRGDLRRHARRPDHQGQAVLLPLVRKARARGAPGHRRDRLRLPGRGAGRHPGGVRRHPPDRARRLWLRRRPDAGLGAGGGREDPRQARLEHQRHRSARRFPTSAPRATN